MGGVRGRVKLPDGKALIPGVLDSTTNYIEHPELVAQRIVRYAQLVGRENIFADSDCGFATFASYSTIDPAITLGEAPGDGRWGEARLHPAVVTGQIALTRRQPIYLRTAPRVQLVVTALLTFHPRRIAASQPGERSPSRETGRL